MAVLLIIIIIFIFIGSIVIVINKVILCNKIDGIKSHMG